MEETYQRKELAYRCLIDAARSLSSAADIDELVGQILSSSRDVMQCWACSISLPDPETGDLVIRGTQAELKGQVLRVPLGKGIAGRVYRTRLRENTANAQSRRRSLYRNRVGDEDARAGNADHTIGGRRCLSRRDAGLEPGRPGAV